MKNKRNTILLSMALVLTLPIIGYAVLNLSNFGFSTNANAQDHSNACYFNHYEAVEPTEDSHGSKEFWACCNHLSFLLEEPEHGTIHEAGPFGGIYFDELDENDDRYIPALPKTRTIKFFCDDLLLETRYVKDGSKLDFVSSDDFVISGWYKEKELVTPWNFSIETVEGDFNLFSAYVAKNKSFFVDVENAAEVDSYGFSATTDLDKEICVSKGITPVDSFAVLENRGILFNKSEIGIISQLSVDVDSENFDCAKIFYGNTPLSFDFSYELSSGSNVLDLNGAEYFTIQNVGDENIKINSLNIEYVRKTIYDDDDIPQVVINTKNAQSVTSRTTYVDCDVSTIGAEKDVSGLKAQIKVRGNSTASCPKKPYRIKLNKKNSLFGYEKAKNWVLLADYMDGSKMHNYTALKFAKMIKGEDSFCVDPMHVNVILNGENIGLYVFCEHIDAKEGRLNIEQEKIWEKSFDEINFYIERDLSTAQDSTEVEGVTYFRVDMENYSPSQYVFALKYPEKEDFEEELENGDIDYHEEEFQLFFNNLKDYMTDICNQFVAYSQDVSEFSNLQLKVDVESLAEYAVVDQTFDESDHSQKSFKMYRFNSELLKFGPNWDYDSCAYALPYMGTYILNPFESTYSGSFKSTWFGEAWGFRLYNDLDNGKILFNNVWDKVSNDMITDLINAQKFEVNRIQKTAIYDCERWMNNLYYCLFDNSQYYWMWVVTQIPFLKNYYLSI